MVAAIILYRTIKSERDHLQLQLDLAIHLRSSHLSYNEDSDSLH